MAMLPVFESERYVDQLLLTDPELIAVVDASMSRAGYRRVELADLDPDMVKAIACRDRPPQEFRPQNDRLVYTGDGSIVQVRRYGDKGMSY